MPTQTSGLSARVVACIEGGRTRLEERRLPAPVGGEILLSLRVSGLCGTDLFKLLNRAPAPGDVLGHELVGTVEALGPEARGFEIGDRVVVPHHVACGECALCLRGSGTLCAAFRENLLHPGGFSDRVLVRERAARLAARKVPSHVSDEAAVFLEPAACVLRGISRAGLSFLDRAPEGKRPPACAVVLGAGSMGLLHLLVLRSVHPGLPVVISDRVPERLELARDLGASIAREPGDAGLRAVVKELTGGLGADAVFDTVGGAGLLKLALALAREGGTTVLFAHAPRGERADFELNDLFKHERRVVGTYSSTLAEQEEVYRLIVSGRLDASPLVTHRLPLSRFQEGVDLSLARKALKVLLVPG